MNQHDEYERQNQFGFRLFSGLFMISSSMANLRLLTKLFSKTKTIILYTREYINGKWDWGQTTELNKVFVEEVVNTINDANNNLKLEIESIMITKPKSDISAFIKKYKQKFVEINWRIYQDTYNDSFWGNCSECLFISPNNA